jgi:hypothetical protein
VEYKSLPSSFGVTNKDEKGKLFFVPEKKKKWESQHPRHDEKARKIGFLKWIRYDILFLQWG